MKLVPDSADWHAIHGTDQTHVLPRDDLLEGAGRREGGGAGQLRVRQVTD